MRYSTITAVGSFTALDESAGDYLYLDPKRCAGGADAGTRPTVEPKAGADGAWVFPTLDDAQIITLAGEFACATFAGIDTILASLKSAVNGMKSTPGSLVHSGGTLSVIKYAPIESGWENGRMQVTFGLVVVT